MDDQDGLQQKIADIGNRYLRRTLGELEKLRELVAAVHGGDAGARLKIQHMAHKIQGSGSMFGFDDVSERARDLEQLAMEWSEQSGGQALPDDQLLEQLEARTSALEEQVRSAARQRGIE